MKKLYYFFLICAFFGCTNVEDQDPNYKPEGYFELTIDDMPDSNFNVTGNCNSGIVVSFSQDRIFSGYKTLQIQAANPLSAGTGILVSVNFQELPPDGNFPLGGDPDNVADLGFGTLTIDGQDTFMTDENHTGYLQITHYDQAAQTVSGNFEFSAAYYGDDGEPNGDDTSVHGNFTNIPITDSTDPDHLKGPCFGSIAGSLGDPGSGTPGQTTVTFNNTTFTKLAVTINGVTKVADPGANAVFYGTPSTAATGTASTSGTTSSGTPVGLTIVWNDLNYNFPASGNQTVSMMVSPSFFFLKVNNHSSYEISKVYVNYGLSDQTLDNITIAPNNTTTYNLGYYRFFSNSNVRAETSNGTYWAWNNLGLSGGANQSVTVTANN